jgi:tungstate transport system ATP-binding protein
MAAELAIQARGLSHRYGAREVLHNVSLDIPRGGVFCIFGPNGAGKSTLLRLLDLVETPAGGEIMIGGARVTPSLRPALRRRMAMAFQSPYMFRASVGANVTYGLRVRSWPRRQRGARAHEVLEQVGALDLIRQPAWRLSRGEAQLVSMARALAVRPEILFLDEPSTSLDPSNAGRIEALIAEYAARSTVVLVTHNLFQARRLAHRAAFLHEGAIVEHGIAAEILSAPRDRRTIAFISGEMPG